MFPGLLAEVFCPFCNFRLPFCACPPQEPPGATKECSCGTLNYHCGICGTEYQFPPMHMCGGTATLSTTPPETHG